jgi:hypothetical protein
LRKTTKHKLLDTLPLPSDPPFCRVGDDFYSVGVHFYTVGVDFYRVGVDFYRIGVEFYGFGLPFYRIGTRPEAVSRPFVTGGRSFSTKSAPGFIRRSRSGISPSTLHPPSSPIHPPPFIPVFPFPHLSDPAAYHIFVNLSRNVLSGVFYGILRTK